MVVSKAVRCACKARTQPPERDSSPTCWTSCAADSGKEPRTPSELQIRIAEPRDIETIAALNLAMAWETEHRQLCPLTIRRGIRAVFDDANYGFYVVAQSDGEVVGCLLITFEWSDWRSGLFWWIQSLYVRPGFRRRGVFKQLHDFVKGQASRRPEVCGIRLYVERSNHIAQNAYGQIGMKPTTYQMYEEMLKCTVQEHPAK